MPLKAVQTEGGGAVVSLLEKGTRRYLAIVNRDFRAALPLAVTFDAAAGMHSIRKDGTTHALAPTTYSTPIEPGDLVLLNWEITPLTRGLWR